MSEYSHLRTGNSYICVKMFSSSLLIFFSRGFGSFVALWLSAIQLCKKAPGCLGRGVDACTWDHAISLPLVALMRAQDSPSWRFSSTPPVLCLQVLIFNFLWFLFDLSSSLRGNDPCVFSVPLNSCSSKMCGFVHMLFFFFSVLVSGRACSPWRQLKLLLHLFGVWVCPCHGIHGEIKGQLVRIGSLPPWGAWD